MLFKQSIVVDDEVFNYVELLLSKRSEQNRMIFLQLRERNGQRIKKTDKSKCLRLGLTLFRLLSIRAFILFVFASKRSFIMEKSDTPINLNVFIRSHSVPAKCTFTYSTCERERERARVIFVYINGDLFEKPLDVHHHNIYDE